MSCSSQDSITLTAQDKPDQIDGNTTTFVISGSAHQINPIQANQNSGEGFTINNRCEAPGGRRTRDIPIVGSSSKNSSPSKDQKKRKQTHVGSSSKNSSTLKDQKKQKQTHGGTTNFEISGGAYQINPTQANQNIGANFTINNSQEAPIGNPTSDIPIGTGKKVVSSSKNSSTSKDQEKWKQTHGDTTTFEISGRRNKIDPNEANENSKENFTINNSQEAPVGNPTSDIPIGTGEKGCSSSKKSSTSKDQNKWKQTHGGTTNFKICSRADQINPTLANQNKGGNFRINNRQEAPVGNPTGDILIGAGEKVGSSSKNSSTAIDQKNWKQTHGGTTTIEIPSWTNQINPAQANQNRGVNFRINNSQEAPIGNPTGDIQIGAGEKVGSSSKKSSTSKDQKNWKQTHGGITNFEVSGWANQINPTQANQNQGDNFTINNSQEAPVSNPTSDIPTGTGKKRK